MNIKTVLQSGETARYHSHSGIDKQPVSQHMWGVMMIVRYIYPEAHRDLLFAAATHDCAEYYTGDIPAPVKWYNSDIKDAFRELESSWEKHVGINVKINGVEHRILKLADMMEGMWYCVQQLKVGHKAARRPYRKWAKRVMDMLYEVPNERAHNVYKMIDKEYKKWK